MSALSNEFSQELAGRQERFFESSWFHSLFYCEWL